MSDVLKKAIEQVGNKFEDLTNYFGSLEMEKVIKLNEFEETSPINISEGYWQINSPISIEESKLIERINLKTNENSRYATVIYRNVSNLTVKAIRGIVTYLNAFDEDIESKMFEIVDLNAKPGELFGHRFHAKITNMSVRNLKLTMIKIMYTNRQKWLASIDNSTILSNLELFTDEIRFKDELSKLKYSLLWNQFTCHFELSNYLKLTDTYWICPCGTLNNISNESRCVCHSNLKKIQIEMTDKSAEKAYSTYKESMEKLENFLSETNKTMENDRIKKMITISKPVKKTRLSKKNEVTS